MKNFYQLRFIFLKKKINREFLTNTKLRNNSNPFLCFLNLQKIFFKLK